MRHPKVGAVAAAGLLALGAAACGGSGGEGDSAQQTPQQQRSPELVANISDLDGQTTNVELSPTFFDGLEFLNIQPDVVGGARLRSGVAKFPITSGQVKYFKPGTASPYVRGMIQHQGSGLSLTAEWGKRVELTDFEVDPGGSVLRGRVKVDGNVAADQVPLFFLDGSTLQPLRTNENGRPVLEGTSVKLRRNAAALLNETFGVQAFDGGLNIGTAKITLAR